MAEKKMLFRPLILIKYCKKDAKEGDAGLPNFIY
jgi:hypothetical protein